MQSQVLEVNGLTKKFGNFSAVDNVSFSIADGEIFGLLGKNGAGKTTTIQMLLGMMEPTSGIITYFGKDLKKHREEILRDANFSSTYISMPWFFTVEEILDIFARLYEVKDRKKRIAKLAQEFEIDHLLKKEFYMLSAGEKTRLFMAKAFLNYPKIILLDEPTASLDVDIAVKIREFLKKEKKEYNVSMLLTSHNMKEVEELCDRVMIIKNGKIIDEDKPENLAKKFSRSTLELLIIDDNKKALEFFNNGKVEFKKNKYRFIIEIDEQNISSLLINLAKENIGYSEILINKPDLEDYFLEAVKEKKNELE
jgi:ABC-2 type transport system ATP-binding protein